MTWPIPPVAPEPALGPLLLIYLVRAAGLIGMKSEPTEQDRIDDDILPLPPRAAARQEGTKANHRAQPARRAAQRIDRRRTPPNPHSNASELLRATT